MANRLRTDSDFDSFLLDHFDEEVRRAIPSSENDRMARENALIQKVGAEAILRALERSGYELPRLLLARLRSLPVLVSVGACLFIAAFFIIKGCRIEARIEIKISSSMEIDNHKTLARQINESELINQLLSNHQRIRLLIAKNSPDTFTMMTIDKINQNPMAYACVSAQAIMAWSRNNSDSVLNQVYEFLASNKLITPRENLDLGSVEALDFSCVDLQNGDLAPTLDLAHWPTIAYALRSPLKSLKPSPENCVIPNIECIEPATMNAMQKHLVADALRLSDIRICGGQQIVLINENDTEIYGSPPFSEGKLQFFKYVLRGLNREKALPRIVKIRCASVKAEP